MDLLAAREQLAKTHPHLLATYGDFVTSYTAFEQAHKQFRERLDQKPARQQPVTCRHRL